MSWLRINCLFAVRGFERGDYLAVTACLIDDDAWCSGNAKLLRFSTRKVSLALISLINFLVEKIYDLIRFISCFPFKPFKCCFEAEGRKKGGERERKFYYDPLVKVN